MIMYLDYEVREAEVGREGDFQTSIVGIFSFVLQTDIHPHPPPVSFYDPQRTLGPPFTQMLAESTVRLYRLCTELSGRQRRNCKRQNNGG